MSEIKLLLSLPLSKRLKLAWMLLCHNKLEFKAEMMNDGKKEEKKK